MTVNADQLLEFIQGEVPPPHLTTLGLATDLRKDLRMTEEDAEELLFKLFQTFGIAVGDFDFGRYFPQEGSPFSFLKKKPAPVPLTVAMLLAAAQAGIWETGKIEQA